MNILIEIKDRKINLVLQSGRKTADVLEFPEDHDLSTKLLMNIDKLITRNKLTLKDVKNIKVRADLPTGYTTVRIAETVAKTWNYAVRIK